MIPLLKNTCKRSQQGQAATEFVVASIFLLIPLFLIIPLLGKYIDIRHAAINQARFEAWEYTAWNGPHEDPKIDIKATQSAGKKSYAATRAQGKNYFFSDPTSVSYGTPGSSFQSNPLWVDHRGESLFPTSAIISGGINEEETEHSSLMGHILDTILKGIGDVLVFFGDIMNSIHVDAKFDALYTKGYFNSTVNVKVRSLDDILPQYSPGTVSPSPTQIPLVIQAKAAVLSNNWNAGSTENTSAESRGLVFTAALKPLTDTINGVVSKINGLTSHIPLLRVQLPSVPDFGYVQDDLIPYEHLEGNSAELQEEEGLYYYREQ